MTSARQAAVLLVLVVGLRSPGGKAAGLFSAAGNAAPHPDALEEVDDGIGLMKTSKKPFAYVGEDEDLYNKGGYLKPFRTSIDRKAFRNDEENQGQKEKHGEQSDLVPERTQEDHDRAHVHFWQVNVETDPRVRKMKNSELTPERTQDRWKHHKFIVEIVYHDKPELKKRKEEESKLIPDRIQEKIIKTHLKFRPDLFRKRKKKEKQSQLVIPVRTKEESDKTFREEEEEKPTSDETKERGPVMSPQRTEEKRDKIMKETEMEIGHILRDIPGIGPAIVLQRRTSL